MKKKKEVDVAHARYLAFKKIFGDDGIENLSVSDEKLIRRYYGNMELPTYGPKIELELSKEAFPIGTVRPCPAAQRNALDRAVGRCIRMNAQRVMIEEWFKRKAPPARFGAYDRQALLKALSKVDEQPSLGPGRGRRGDLAEQVEQDIRAELEAGTLTLGELREMKLKDIGPRFGCEKDTASRVKKSILNSQK
jgi:hypothetical protein